MVQKYAHLSSEHLAQWVDRRPAVLAENLPKSGTFLTTGKEKGARLLAKPLDCLVGTNGLEPSTPWMSIRLCFCNTLIIFALLTHPTSPSTTVFQRFLRLSSFKVPSGYN
jgi:hypothetical protein